MAEEYRRIDGIVANRTFWQKKLDSSLVYLFESDSYLRTGVISEQDVATLALVGYVIPSDQVPGKFGITKTTDDVIFVEITFNKTASVHDIDPYAVNISSIRENRMHCWIEISSLQKVASLADVKFIDFVLHPLSNSHTGGYW